MQLLTIENGQQLEAVAARQYMAWINAVDAELGFHVPLVEGNRTYARQAYYFDGWIRRLPGFNLALSPDTPSEHQKALAADLGAGVGTWSSRAHKVAEKHAAAYGWSFPTVEGWHAQFDPSRVTLWAESDIRLTYGAGPWSQVKRDRDRLKAAQNRAHKAAAAEAARILLLKRDKNVMWIKSLKSGLWYLIGDTVTQTVSDPVEAKAISLGLGYNAQQLPSKTCRRLIDRCAARAKVHYAALAKATGLTTLAAAVEGIADGIAALGDAETYSDDATDSQAPVADLS